MNGKIICINKYIHTVLLDNGKTIDTQTRGKLRQEKVYPVVGDNVLVDVNKKTIEKVLERKNYLERPLISNIDKLLIVMSTSVPVFSSYLIDKFILIAKYNDIEPIVIITKTDQISKEENDKIREYVDYYRSIGIKTYYNTQIDLIREEFNNSVVSLCGQTGVGKSTLLNRINPELKLKTGEVSDVLGRGKHTTRLVELLQFDNGLIADTPGFSSLELNIPKREIRFYYNDFDYVCKYNKSCLHIKEDGCEIINQVNNGTIPKWRYDNYVKFVEESKL